jgi:hypothetical protein
MVAFSAAMSSPKSLISTTPSRIYGRGGAGRQAGGRRAPHNFVTRPDDAQGNPSQSGGLGWRTSSSARRLVPGSVIPSALRPLFQSRSATTCSRGERYLRQTDRQTDSR